MTSPSDLVRIAQAMLDAELSDLAQRRAHEAALAKEVAALDDLNKARFSPAAAASAERHWAAWESQRRQTLRHAQARARAITEAKTEDARIAFGRAEAMRFVAAEETTQRLADAGGRTAAAQQDLMVLKTAFDQTS